jgi:hypothetical protein
LVPLTNHAPVTVLWGTGGKNKKAKKRKEEKRKRDNNGPVLN